MEQNANPISLITSVITFVFGAASLQDWLMIVSAICAVLTTVSAIRVNRAKRRYYSTQNRQANPKIADNDQRK